MSYTYKMHNNVVIIATVEENIDASNVADFKKYVYDFIKNDITIVLNMQSLKFVDSSAIGSLIMFQRELTSKNGTLKLCNITRSVRALFELMRLSRVFEIYNSEEAALA